MLTGMGFATEWMSVVVFNVCDEPHVSYVENSCVQPQGATMHENPETSDIQVLVVMWRRERLSRRTSCGSESVREILVTKGNTNEAYSHTQLIIFNANVCGTV